MAGLNAREDAANFPNVVIADIDEILRLRAEVERLEKEAHWLATHVVNALREPALIAHLHYLSNGLTVTIFRNAPQSRPQGRGGKLDYE